MDVNVDDDDDDNNNKWNKQSTIFKRKKLANAKSF